MSLAVFSPKNIFTLLVSVSLLGCAESKEIKQEKDLSKPLVSHIFTADPSAHVFNGRIYIYPSHDVEAGIPENDLGDHFDMRDYHVFSMDSIGGEITDHGVVLNKKDIPWAGRQLWAPDAAFKDGTYYLYFPMKDTAEVFRIGVATSKDPAGPFTPEPKPIEGSYSIDPAVFKDTDGSYYMYFGGIWGGQLQKWNNNVYDSAAPLRDSAEQAVLPKVVKMADDMKSFAEVPRDIRLVDSAGNLFLESQNDNRFFEAAWVHKYNDKYYFSYSTGDTHFIAYATGDNPYGPFTYQGVILKPVKGWTNHHSIVEVNGKWYLFYHDTEISGKTHLRNIKVAELHYNEDGSIQTIDPYPEK